MERRELLATFVVDNTGDTGPGTLRQAILDANVAPGPDDIAFAIPGAGVQTISPTSPLPAITDPVVIDAYTQPGASANILPDGNNAVLLIELNGLAAGGFGGIQIDAGNSTVRGLVINRFDRAGILVQTNGGNRIEGNFIGTDATGTQDLGNSAEGVLILSAPGNTIGGTAAGARNLISGNNGSGVRLLGLGAANNLVQGNFIGTNATGTVALGNSLEGILVQDPAGNTIGGTAAGARNLISGNTREGLRILFNSASNTVVQGNFIGTDVTGTIGLGNGASGVLVQDAGNNTIGGTAAGARNIVSGNSDGIVLVFPSAVGNVVQGNLIGTAIDGTSGLGNTFDGVTITVGASDNTVGGTAPGAGNVIAFNGRHGVQVFAVSSINNAILSNSIRSNGALGIDLNGDNVPTPNDLGPPPDTDTGANNLQNFPDITAVTPIGESSTVVSATLNSTPNTNFTVEVFTSTTADPSGFGEGQTFFGRTTVTTDGSGNALVMVFGTPVSGQGVFTATATDPAGNTSEFSGVFVVPPSLGFVVTNTNDTGSGSLRQVITDANAAPGLQTITFLIPGTGVQTIVPLTPLPAVTDTVVIDARTQPGFAGTPIVEISGQNLAGNVHGLTLTANDSAIRALVINRFPLSGILVTGTGNQIVGNYLGTDATGTIDLGNGVDGVTLQNTTGNTVGGLVSGDGNLISGNNAAGVGLSGADFNVVVGNRIGSDATGTIAIGNDGGGVLVNLSQGTTIGGVTFAERNLISGNTLAPGIRLTGPMTTGNAVLGNLIGLNSSGTAALPNLGGIVLDTATSANTIGGTSPSAANVISGNLDSGVAIFDSSNILVAGNRIGTDATGTIALGNQASGVVIGSASSAGQGTTIGGLTPDAGNLISANGSDGVVLFGAGAVANLVIGNRIGTDAAGTARLNNGSNGVVVTGGASSNTIGGARIPAGNLISSTINGVNIDGLGTTANVLAGNFIGTNAASAANLGNGGAGVAVFDGATLTLIGTNGDGVQDDQEGNAIAGNVGSGIVVIDDGTDNTVIAGNRIGLNASGNLVVPNAGRGVEVLNGPEATIIGLGSGSLVTPDQANVIAGNALEGIFLGGVTAAIATAIRGNRIGTDLSGTTAFPNGRAGVAVLGASGTLIDGNQIAGNLAEGILISGPSSAGTLVTGNLIGTDPVGNTALPNQGAGIRVDAGAVGATIGGTSDTGNQISGNAGGGVQIVGASATLVASNRIGTDAAGSVAVPNQGAGVLLALGTTDSTIGGTSPDSSNLLSGNTFEGLAITDAGTTRNSVLGNRIGTNAAGNLALPNGTSGVIVFGAVGNRIGESGAGNLISGNVGAGVLFVAGANGNVVESNTIGTDVSGTIGIGNFDGINVDGSNDNVIGGLFGTGNLISGNRRTGIVIVNNAARNVAVGNVVGLDSGRSADLGNALDGISLSVGAVDNTIGGLNFFSFVPRNFVAGNGRSGISIFGATTARNVVVGNYVGLDAGGNVAIPNDGSGITLSEGATDNTVGGAAGGTVGGATNVVSGNRGFGIELFTGAARNLVIGNIVGLNPSGTQPIGNAGAGIVLQLAATDNTIGIPGAGNVVGGNTQSGIVFATGASGNRVQANILGTDVGGTLDLGNGLNGVTIFQGATNNTIGGTAPNVANVIVGNAQFGVRISDVGTTGNLVAGNLIGPSLGQSGLEHANDNVRIEQGASGNTIGGPTAAARNVISGSLLFGVRIAGATTTGNLIAGNFIGTDPSGTVARGNNTGVLIEGATGNTIGGASTGLGNLISGNVGNGVNLDQGAVGNLIAGNLIGTDPTGTIAVGNGFRGLAATFGARDNTIGGTSPLARNVLSGNGSAGIDLFETAGPNVVLGNFIGVDASGARALPNPTGLGIGSGANTIGGLVPGSANVISGNQGDGIRIGSAIADNNLIVGNLIGTNATGTAAIGNAIRGIELIDGSSDNTIGGLTPAARNVISANFTGVFISETDTSGNRIVGNFIGTDRTGTIALGNLDDGITIDQAADNTIGGVEPGAGNVISGNLADGVEVNQTATRTGIVGNRIGTDPNGSFAVANGLFGLRIVDAIDTTIGGTASGAGNLISGNGQLGIEIFLASRTVVLGNLIGTNGLGFAALPNGTDGILIRNGTTGSRIGGFGQGAGNLIAGNLGHGIRVADLATQGNLIQGNLIGRPVGASGTLGNGLDGIAFFGAGANTVGTAGSGGVNVITANRNGVSVTNSPAITILGNSIFNNVLLGIAFPNGPGFPVINLATRTGNQIAVAGTLTAQPNSLYRIQFFLDAGDPSGFGEGQELIGELDVTTDSAGLATFTGQFVTASQLPVVTATATRAVGPPGSAAFVETSGFSAFVAVFVDPTLSFTVVNTADLGLGSLRQAIRNANQVPGVQTIDFAIPGVGPFTILLVTALPELTEAVAIDATTQPGFAGTPIVLVDGSNATEPPPAIPGSGEVSVSNVVHGLVLAVAGNTIRGLAIGGFSGSGLVLEGDRNLVDRNFVGLRPDGLTPLPNRSGGVVVLSTGNTIGGPTSTAANAISGNLGDGVRLAGRRASGNVVAGNVIGLDRGGAGPVGNSRSGIAIDEGAFGNVIGGVATGDGNLVGGNGLAGIELGAGANGNVVAGNAVGVDRNGLRAVGNSVGGIVLNGAADNLIGGVGNLVSGNFGNGIFLIGPSTTRNRIEANFVGVNNDGDARLPNAGSGVVVHGAPGNTIGGAGRNVISGNDGSGIIVGGPGSSSTRIVGNYIGTDVRGLFRVGNADDGIFVEGSGGNTIGGPALADRNLISGNGSVGVQLFGRGATGNLVVGNLIGTDAAGERAVGNLRNGLYINEAPGNTIGGTAAGSANLISGNEIVGLQITGPGASGNVVVGNFLGTTLAGDRLIAVDPGLAPAGRVGVFVEDAPGNQIGGSQAGAGNLVAGFREANVLISGPLAAGNRVEGNRLGTDATGRAALGGGYGLFVNGSPGNTIGGGAPGQGNLISGNEIGVGVATAGATGNLIAGNLVGTDATGTGRLANRLGGLFLNGAPGNTIGGPVAGAGNVLSGNGGPGIQLFGAGTSGNLLQGNLIGTDRSATIPLGNAGGGLFVNGAPNNLIGGTEPGTGNVISANALFGVQLFGQGTAGNRVFGNLIGTIAPPSSRLGNQVGLFVNGSPNNTIGGLAPGQANAIVGNLVADVFISPEGAGGGTGDSTRLVTGATTRGVRVAVRGPRATLGLRLARRVRVDAPGPDGLLGTADDQRLTIAGATGDRATGLATIRLARGVSNRTPLLVTVQPVDPAQPIDQVVVPGLTTTARDRLPAGPRRRS